MSTCCESLHPGGLDLTARAMELAALPVGAQIADVGCGAGASAAMLREQFGLTVLGVEPDGGEEMLCGRADELPFADGSLDGVLCECVLSIVPDHEAAVREFFRVLRPGGVLWVSDLYARAESDDDGVRTESALRKEFTDAGFIIEAFEDHTPELQSMAAKILWEGGDAAACTGRDLAALRRLRCGYYLCAARKGSVNDIE
ncbi:MAG: methyltransferase domain-containing protein [Eubacteriales bacterium]|nr:methyltransferase domain-containing protein [Eubacteriales bacterium]